MDQKIITRRLTMIKRVIYMETSSMIDFFPRKLKVQFKRKKKDKYERI